MKRALEEIHAWYGNHWTTDAAPPPPPTPPDDRHKQTELAHRLGSKDPAVLARVGLVMGRFRPPHVGHVHLVEQAFAQCGWLHVASPSMAGPGRELHDSAVRYAFGAHADVHLVQAPGNARDPASWAHVVDTLAPRPTHLFSSDPGAAALAHAAKLEHILVDPSRAAFPVSSSMIRADIARHFSLIAPSARQWFAFTVAIAGAEGAGKSTLARELGVLFDAPVVDDPLLAAARAEGGPPRMAEFFNIYHNRTPGRMQRASNETATGIVISEDCRLLTALWAKRLGYSLQLHSGNHYKDERRELWLLCHNDFPYSGERNEPEDRRRFFEEVRRELQAMPHAVVVDITGEGQARVEIAASAIRERFAQHVARVREWMS